MIIPTLQETLVQDNFFIYTAADSVYFDTHARPLINSVRKNAPDLGIHIHLYDPTPEQIAFCQQPMVSYTYELLDHQSLAGTTEYWLTRTDFTNDRQRQMYKKGQTLGRDELHRLVKQTYYACARFIRLAQILPQGKKCLAIDVDGLVRKPFDYNLGSADFYLYEKPKDGTHLAGAILFNGQSGTHEFLQNYAGQLTVAFERDDVYWFLDQYILDQLVPRYVKGLLPMSYIDWAMRTESAIWSAKGKRKELEVFKKEQQRYAQ